MRLINAEPYEDCRIVLHKEDEGVSVEELPTVEAVEVVRCKDCVNHGKCTAEDTFLFSGIADGFCRVGKRKASD